MSLTSPRYWLKADSGRTSPVNAVTESGALTGGTVTLTEITTGVWAYRCTGSASTATFTALAIDGGGTFGPEDGHRTWAIRAAIGTMPTGGFPRLFGFSASSDLDTNGTKVARNGSDTDFLAWVPGNGDSVAIGAALSISTTLKTIVIKHGAVSGVDTLSVWIEQTGRSGSTPDFTGAGVSLSEVLMEFDTFVVQPGGGSLDIADAVLWEPGDLSDADCAIAADGLRAALSPAGPVITGPSGTGSVLTGNGSCSTTGSTGLLWWKADASSTASDPGAGSEAGAGWTSQAVSGSGTQTVASFGALTAGTKYVHYLHVDGSSNRSTVADSSSFTVLAAAANSPRTFRPLFLNL